MNKANGLPVMSTYFTLRDVFGHIYMRHQDMCGVWALWGRDSILRVCCDDSVAMPGALGGGGVEPHGVQVHLTG